MKRMTSDIVDTKTKKRNHWAWYMYDFGNSAYAAVILLAVYSAYFKGSVVGGAEGSRLWGFSLGIAMLVVAVISPFLGTIADFTAAKKRILFVFSSLSWVFTALLFFVEKGDIFTGMLFFILAEIGYRGGQVFYNALLTDIATPDEIGRVSGNGWAIGSVGGIICLLFILPVIVLTDSNPLVVRGSFAFTAVFFILSSLPLFMRLQERGVGRSLPPGENYLGLAFKRLKNTFAAVRDFREFIKFIISFLIYNDGILMALDFAAIIGAVLYGMTQTQLIIFMIVVQVTSAIGAYVFGIWGEKTGFKQTLIYSILMMIGAIVWMMFNTTLTGYFIIGALAGFALTGVQSLSRTITGLFAPQNKATEFFGFFAVAGRSSSFIGPTIYGIVAFRAAMYFEGQGMGTLLAEQAGQRAGIFSIAIFLIIGLLLLVSVNEKHARKIAIEHAAAAAD
jgi:MFS transporter, UMF1 family